MPDEEGEGSGCAILGVAPWVRLSRKTSHLIVIIP